MHLYFLPIFSNCSCFGHCERQMEFVNIPNELIVRTFVCACMYCFKLFFMVELTLMITQNHLEFWTSHFVLNCQNDFVFDKIPMFADVLSHYLSWLKSPFEMNKKQMLLWSLWLLYSRMRVDAIFFLINMAAKMIHFLNTNPHDAHM